MIRICHLCKSIFHKKRSGSVSGHYFCSSKCSNEYKKKPNNTNCSVCGKAMRIDPSRLKRTKNQYCCRDHWLAHHTKLYIIKEGYKRILLPTHRRADSKGYVREHIVIIENKLGRPLKAGEVVHHVDGNKLNNAPENLQPIENHSLHVLMHHRNSMCRNPYGRRGKPK